jgi:hypothetical protein
MIDKDKPNMTPVVSAASHKQTARRYPPGKALHRQNYQRLVLLLADPDSGKVLHHAAKIDDLAIAVLADLPKPLRRPLAFAIPDWPRKLNGLADGLRFLVSRGVVSNLDDAVAKLATMTAGAPIGCGRSVLGRQFASAANDAACNSWPRSAP